MAISYNEQMVGWMKQSAAKYNIDYPASMAVALSEGGLVPGAVGDGGTSFGPFQLHVGGALPKNRGAAWANSRAGIDYAYRKMAETGSSGLTGAAAIGNIIRKFERPADPDNAVSRAKQHYSHLLSGGLGKGVRVNGQVLVDDNVVAPNVPGSRQNNLVSALLKANVEFARTGKLRSDIITAALIAKAENTDTGVRVGKRKPISVPAGQLGDPEKALRHSMKVARDKFGLTVLENNVYDPVNPDVHTPTSNHYQHFSGSTVNRAADISGDPASMMAFTKWANKTYGGMTRELFYDPWGGTKGTTSIGAIGGHSDHVHIAY